MDSFSTRWEERRAAILTKMENWVRTQGRWKVYQTYLQKYTSPEWVKRQFPAYGPDSLELARRMLMQQAAQMAVEYTPAELAALEKQGFNPIHYFMERHDAWSVEAQMIRNEEAVVVKPIRAELSEMADGFGSNGIFEVVEALKGSLKPGDTIRIRQRSSMDAAHPTDLIPLNMREQMSRKVMDQQTLVYLSRKGGMRYTTAPGRTPVRLPAGVYYLGNSVPVSGEQLHPKDLMALSHPTTMADVRRVAGRFAK